MSSVCSFPASGSSVISSCQRESASRRKATLRTSVSRAAQSGANACVNAFQQFHGSHSKDRPPWHSMALPGCLRADCPFASAGCGGGASYTSTALSKAFHRLCQRWSVRRAVHPDAALPAVWMLTRAHPLLYQPMVPSGLTLLEKPDIAVGSLTASRSLRHRVLHSGTRLVPTFTRLRPSPRNAGC